MKTGRLVPIADGPFSIYMYNKNRREYIDRATMILLGYDYSEIYDELKLGDIKFDLTPRSPDRDNNFATTPVTIKRDKKGNVIASTNCEITVYMYSLVMLALDIWAMLDSTNTEIFDNILHVLIETMLAHELRHCYQIKHVYAKLDESAIYTDADGHLHFCEDFVYRLEADANDYMLSKISYTHMSDTELKTMLTKVEYICTKMDILERFDPNVDLTELTSDLMTLMKDLNVYTNEKYPS